MSTEFAAATLVRLHDHTLLDPATRWPAQPEWVAAAANHRCNCQLWDEEDRARRTDVPAAAIAASKRLIDQYNQQRNDAVEAIDEALLSRLGAAAGQGARLHSETAGAMVDRLSILALKIIHMRAQTERVDVAPAHVQLCQRKLARLHVQRADLAGCLDTLLAETAAGQVYFKVYRQFKMYNDPALNPYLYGQRPTPPAEEA